MHLSEALPRHDFIGSPAFDGVARHDLIGSPSLAGVARKNFIAMALVAAIRIIVTIAHTVMIDVFVTFAFMWWRSL